jgi:hypothetical protein
VTDAIGSQARQVAGGMAGVAETIGGEAERQLAGTVAVLDRVLERQPQEAEGSIATTLAEAGIADTRRLARKLLSGELNVYQGVRRAGEAGREVTDLGRRVLDDGARWASQTRETVQEGLDRAESLLEGPDFFDEPTGMLLRMAMPPGLNAARRTTLRVVRAGQEASETADLYRERADDLMRMARATDPKWLQRRVGELDRGDSYAVEVHGELDVKRGFGAQVGGGARLAATRTGRGYEVSATVDTGAGVGPGVQIQKEGVGADGALMAGGELALHCTGPDAARRAAELMAAAQGDVGMLREVAEAEGIEVQSASGRFGAAIGGELGAGVGLSGEFQAASSSTVERIDGRLFAGEGVSVRNAAELSSSVQIQMRDGAVEMRPEEGNELSERVGEISPLAREVIDRMPPEAVEAINDTYGPVGGLTFGGEASGKVRLMRPAGGGGPVRMSAAMTVKGMAGRTEVAVTNSVTVSDAEALVRATGLELATIADRLRGGEWTVDGLRRRIAEQGGTPSDHLEVETEVSLARTDATSVDIAGIGMGEETVDRELLYSRNWLDGESDGALNPAGKRALDTFAGADGAGPLSEEVRDRRMRSRLK